jgi:hypothetical protein
LTQLVESDGETEKLSKVFLKNRNNFELYIPYTLNRQYSESTLNSYETIRKFFDEINTRIDLKNTWISDYLNKPLERIVQYRQFLQVIYTPAYTFKILNLWDLNFYNIGANKIHG